MPDVMRTTTNSSQAGETYKFPSDFNVLPARTWETGEPYKVLFIFRNSFERTWEGGETLKFPSVFYLPHEWQEMTSYFASLKRYATSIDSAHEIREG